MGDHLLLAGLATQPDRLLARLRRHPEIATVAEADVGQRLYQAARTVIRHRRSAAGTSEPGDLVSRGRAEGGRALTRLFSDVRAASGARAVILHDPSGPLFPFLEPPAVSLVVLSRSAESAAAAIGAAGVARVVDAARDAMAAFEGRVASFGVPAARTVTIDEDQLEDDPAAALAGFCRAIGVAADPETVSALLAPAPVDVRSKGGA